MKTLVYQRYNYSQKQKGKLKRGKGSEYNISISFYIYLTTERKKLMDHRGNNSPSSLSFFNSCALVGRAYIPAATAFLIAHP